MKASRLLVLTLILTSCISAPVQRTIHEVQTMPNNTADIRKGCLRTLARLALDSGMGHVWSPDRAAIFCDGVERSFRDDIQRRDGGRI